MSHFFQPNSKVQKDRHIMRETDSRMAKYSRRGLIFNFIAFLVCLLSGRFVDENLELTVVLASGLLLVTFLRGYYLFRFDQHYPRGPARWRNVYFVVTLLGAVWWGVILFSVTLTLGLKDETPLLWLYTVVFFSTTAHAFAPYHRFLSYYQFCGLVPAAAAAVIVGEWSGYVYGALMLTFYLILSHQCRLISDNYWEKLEAGYALGKRSGHDDNERSHSQSGAILNREFIEGLEVELAEISTNSNDASAVMSLNKLKDSVQLFKDVQSKSLAQSQRVFNIRHELQSVVAEFVNLAEQNDIQLDTSLSTNLPLRLKGDAQRFGQIVRTVISQCLNNSLSNTMILEAQFRREYESAGELHISIKQQKNKSTSIPFFSDADNTEFPPSLDLAIAKSMAELLGGELEVIELAGKDYEIRFMSRLDIVDRGGQLDFHKNRFQGNKILFATNSAQIASIKRDELDALGFTTHTETHFKKVAPVLTQQIRSGNAVENILIYHDAKDEHCVRLMEDLKEADELRGLNKIIASSEDVHVELIKAGYTEESNFFFVPKPLGLFELESTFDYMYGIKGDEDALRLCKKGTVIIVGNDDATKGVSLHCEDLPNQKIIRSDIQSLEKNLAMAFNIMVVVPCFESEPPMAALDIIRQFEERERQSDNDTFVPVIGVGDRGCSCKDIAAFEIGFDDYIEMDSARSANITSTLRYWRSITQ